MNLPIIQSLWVGDALSNLEKLCIQSFLDHGHEFHLYTHGEVAGIPAGAVVKDANQILPFTELKQFGDSTTKVRSLQRFSDYFRYTLLYKIGGFWVDMDIVCLKPFDFAAEIIYSGMAILKFPNGHPLCKLMLHGCQNHTKPMPFDDAAYARRRKLKAIKYFFTRDPRHKFFSTPHLDKAIQYFNLQHCKAAVDTFHKYKHHNWQELYDDSFATGLNFSPDIYAVNIGSGDLVKAGMDKNAKFNPNSAVEQLKQRHKIG